MYLNSNHLTVHPKSNMIQQQQQRRSRRGRKRRIRLLFQVQSSYLSLAVFLLIIISILAVQVQVQVHAAQVQVQITTTVMILLVHIFPSHITSLTLPPFPSSSLSSSTSSSTSTCINQQQNEDNNNNNSNIIIPPPTKSADELSGMPLPIQPIPQLPPPTPCTRICRYNINCYDGNVCIGCFRDTHDISHWSCFSSKEKQYSLEDAADRCHNQQQLQDQDQQMELSSLESSSESLSESLLSSSSSPSSSESEPESGTHCYEGSISENELRKQAKMWGQYNEDLIE